MLTRSLKKPPDGVVHTAKRYFLLILEENTVCRDGPLGAVLLILAAFFLGLTWSHCWAESQAPRLGGREVY